MLFQQLHAGYHHALVCGLAHVVDGQQRDLHDGEGFHFHPGRAHGFCGGYALHGVVGAQ